MVVDASGAKVSRRPAESGQDDLGVHGLRIDVLLRGEVYDLKTRTVVGAAPPGPGGEPAVR
jgi:cyanophycinase-like exopeptidase